MESVSDARLLGYALLATAVAFGIWSVWFTDTDGGWIFVGAILVFAALAFFDGVVAGRQAIE